MLYDVSKLHLKLLQNLKGQANYIYIFYETFISNFENNIINNNTYYSYISLLNRVTCTAELKHLLKYTKTLLKFLVTIKPCVDFNTSGNCINVNKHLKISLVLGFEPMTFAPNRGREDALKPHIQLGIESLNGHSLYVCLLVYVPKSVFINRTDSYSSQDGISLDNFYRSASL